MLNSMNMLPTGVVLPESVLQSGWFETLMMFVAVNTLVYVCFAVSKILPKIYFSDWYVRRGRRSETRNIDPDAPVEFPVRSGPS